MRGIYHVITIKNNPKAMSCRIGKASSLSHIFLKQDLGNRLSAEKNSNFTKENLYLLNDPKAESFNEYSRQRNESNQDLTEFVKQRIDTLYDEAKEDYITFKRKERQEAKEHNSKPENKNNQKKLPRANFQISKEKFVQELIITYGAEVDISKQDFKNVEEFYKKALDKLGIPKENVLFIAEHNDEKTPHYHIQFINYDFESHTSWNQKRNNMAIKESEKNNDFTSKGEPNILKYKAKQLRGLQDDLVTCFGTERGYKKEVKGRDYKTKQQWITGLEKEIESLEKSKADAVDIFYKVAHELNDKFNNLDEDKKKKDAEILELAERIKKQKAESLQLQQRNEELATNKANLELTIGKLNELLADKQKKLHIIEETANIAVKAERDILQSIKEKEPLAKEVEKLRNTELNLNNSIKDKTSKLASLTTDIKSKDEECKTITNSILKCHEIESKIKKKIDNIKNDLKDFIDKEVTNCINQNKPLQKAQIVQSANQKVKEIMPDFF